MCRQLGFSCMSVHTPGRHRRQKEFPKDGNSTPVKFSVDIVVVVVVAVVSRVLSRLTPSTTILGLGAGAQKVVSSGLATCSKSGRGSKPEGHFETYLHATRGSMTWIFSLVLGLATTITIFLVAEIPVKK